MLIFFLLLAQPQAPRPPQAPPVKEEVKPEPKSRYQWVGVRNYPNQVHLLLDGRTGIGSWFIKERQYWGCAMGVWDKTPSTPPIPPPAKRPQPYELEEGYRWGPSKNGDPNQVNLYKDGRPVGSWFHHWKEYWQLRDDGKWWDKGPMEPPIPPPT